MSLQGLQVIAAVIAGLMCAGTLFGWVAFFPRDGESLVIAGKCTVVSAVVTLMAAGLWQVG